MRSTYLIRAVAVPRRIVVRRRWINTRSILGTDVPPTTSRCTWSRGPVSSVAHYDECHIDGPRLLPVLNVSTYSYNQHACACVCVCEREEMRLSWTNITWPGRQFTDVCKGIAVWCLTSGCARLLANVEFSSRRRDSIFFTLLGVQNLRLITAVKQFCHNWEHALKNW